MTPHFNTIIHPEFQSLAPYFENIEHIFDTQGEIIQQNRNTIKKINLQSYSLVIKSFKTPTPVQGIIYKFFRMSKAQRSYEYALKLLDKGFSTPQPVAYLEQSNGLQLKKSYYISLHLQHEFTIRKILKQNSEKADEILRQFLVFTHHLHEAGILHLDHSPGNTLIKDNGDSYLFSLVDINRMKFGSISTSKRLNNLTRLSGDTEIIRKIARYYAEAAKLSVELCYTAINQATQRHFKNMMLRKRLKKLFR